MTRPSRISTPVTVLPSAFRASTLMSTTHPTAGFLDESVTQVLTFCAPTVAGRTPTNPPTKASVSATDSGTPVQRRIDSPQPVRHTKNATPWLRHERHDPVRCRRSRPPVSPFPGNQRISRPTEPGVYFLIVTSLTGYVIPGRLPRPVFNRIGRRIEASSHQNAK